MPDVLGPFYEGILAHCLNGTWAVKTNLEAERPQATCRSTCPHSLRCKEGGVEPSIDVDPDLLGFDSDGRGIIGFITHWRTTGFEKKFWRTLEEIFEHLIHRPGCIAVSFVAEPISQSDKLRASLGMAAGHSVDLPSQWSPELQASVAYLEDVLQPKLSPATPIRVLEYLESPRSDELLTPYLAATRARLAALDLELASRLTATQLFDSCIAARSSARSWDVRSVETKSRTPTQLLALVMYAARQSGTELTLEDFAKGALWLGGGESEVPLEQLSSVPYRTRGGGGLSFVVVNRSIRGRVLRFDGEVFAEGTRTSSVFGLAKRYLSFMERHPIWSRYLRRLTGDLTGLPDPLCGQRIDRGEICEIVDSAIKLRVHGWKIDLLLAAANLSRVRFAARVNSRFTSLTGMDLKRISPFGDEAKNVLGYCARGQSDLLKPAGELSKSATLSLLAELLVSEFEDDLQAGFDVAAALHAMMVKDMRTFLSGGPHPALASIADILDALGSRYEANVRVPTIITTWHGGNTGRTIYQFVVQRDDGNRLFIKVSTGQDGNEGHKWKELAARMRSHRMVEPSAQSLLVLDGVWTEQAVRKLFESGYSQVISVERQSTISDWICHWLASASGGDDRA